MNYLLDTHILLWILFSKKFLSNPAKIVIFDPTSKIFISAISLWEISLKYRIGKLILKDKQPDQIPDAVEKMNFGILELNSDTASSFYKIPKIKINKDPFDLMLAWQAICGKYTLISADKGFDDYKKYGLKRIW